MNFFLMNFIALIIGSCALTNSNADSSPQRKDEYWGPGTQPNNVDESIRPFKIVFDKQMIDDLKMRLNNTRMPQPTLKDLGWTYGTNSEFMTFVVDYWLNKYDFQKREDYLNQYPQFITNIQGLDIHFLHAKPQLPNDREIEVLPIYIQHGWPGSVVEFYELVPMLTTVHPERDFVFEVIAPSLPGFAFSSAPAKPGLTVPEIARIMKSLMLRLGFTKWYTQGGDWGATIAADMAVTYPEHVLGIHLNMCVAQPSLLTIIRQGLLNKQQNLWILQQLGFAFLQATKPDTIGFAVSDSPAGLAAYFLEKFTMSSRNESYGTGNDRTLLEKYSMDLLLDNLMLYWVPNKATTSFRTYAENVQAALKNKNTKLAKINVPSACPQFPFEIINLPERDLRRRFANMVSSTKMPRGGHFAAMEEPKLLADDVWDAIEKMREPNNSKKSIFDNIPFFHLKN